MSSGPSACEFDFLSVLIYYLFKSHVRSPLLYAVSADRYYALCFVLFFCFVLKPLPSFTASFQTTCSGFHASQRRRPRQCHHHPRQAAPTRLSPRNQRPRSRQKRFLFTARVSNVEHNDARSHANGTTNRWCSKFSSRTTRRTRRSPSRRRRRPKSRSPWSRRSSA